MKYPLTLKCKIIAISPQIYVTDTDDNPVLYVKQKILKLKEHVELFTDKTKEKKLCDIRASGIIDWSASYDFTDENNNPFGGIRRKGLKSLWRARYEIYSSSADGETEFSVSEKSVFTRILDGLFGQIPIIGFLTGYVANPSYLVTDNSGNTVMELIKQPALWEGKFTIESRSELSAQQQTRILVGLIMMVLLEGKRG